MIIKDAVTYAEDASVERFWAGVVRIQDISSGNWSDVTKIATRKIKVKYIHTKYQFSIDPTYKKSSYVEWRQAR